MIAQAPPISNPLLPNFAGWDSTVFFSKLVSNGIGLFFVIAAIIFLFMLIWGAIQWIMSGGDKGAVQSAQSKITNAIIGIVVLISTYAVVAVIGYFFNIPALQMPFQLDISPLIIQ